MAMTGELLRDLTNNLAPLLGLVILHSALLPRLQRGERTVQVLFGLLFGAAAVVGMAFPFQLQSGLIFDGRSVVLGLAGLFFGTLATTIAATVAALYRVQLGGAGLWTGLGVLVTSAAFGLAVGGWARRRRVTPGSTTLWALGLGLSLLSVSWMLILPAEVRLSVLRDVMPVSAGVIAASTWLLGHAFRISLSRHDALRDASEAESRFRGLVEGANVGVYLIQDGRFVYVNPVFERIFGYPADGVVGRPIDDLLMPEERERVRQRVQSALATAGGFDRLLLRARRADGQAFQAELFGSLTRRDGRTAIVGMVVDATERERAAEKLARSERMLRQAQQAGRIGSYVLDVVRGRWTISEVLADILGVAPGAPSTLQQWVSMIAPEQRAMMRTESDRILRSEVRFSHEYQIVRELDGERRWVQASGEVERDAKGKPIRIVGVMKDITDRKQAEQALQRSEALHREAQRVARLGHWELDHASGAMTLSEQAYAVWERDPRTWTATYEQVIESLHPEDRPRIDEAFRASLMRRQRFADEYRLQLPDGRIKFVEAHGETQFGEDGRPLRTVGTIRDITARRKAQDELARELDSTRMMLAAMIDGYVRMDVKGRILDTNPAYCRLIGVDRNEIVGRTIAEFVASGTGQEVSQRIDQTLRAGHMRFSTRHRRKDGTHIEIEASAVSLPGAQPPQIYAFFRDLTQAKRAEAHYEELVTRLPAGVFRYRRLGSVGQFEYLSPRLRELLALEPDEATANPELVFAKMHSEDALNFERRREQSRLRGEPFVWEGRLRHRDPPRWVRVEAGATTEDNGELVWHGIVTDVTVRQQLLERLRLDSAVIKSTFESVMVTELDGTIISVNPAFCEITGYQPDEVIGRKPNLLKSGRQDEAFYQGMYRALQEAGHWQGQLWNRRKSGEIYPELLNISVVRDIDGEPTHYVGVATDISQIKRSEEQLAHLAHHDALTGLPNRVLLALRLEHALERARRDASQLALLFLDLDRFKTVNDSLGHEAGDQLLVAVAERLRSALRAEDTLCRHGGDEFIVLIEHVDDSMAAAKIAQALLEQLAQPFRLAGGRELYVQASIGVCLYPADGEQAEILIRNADTAMFRAKESGRDNYQFYTEALTRAASGRLELETRMRQALRDEQFEVWYQPIYRFGARRIIGAEALLRWRDADGALIPPDRFIPVAEDSGLIVELGRHVLTTGCADLRRWLDQGLAIELLAVNLSVQQFTDPDFERSLAEALRASAVPAALLELELTERGLMDPGAETLDKLRILRALGVRLAIDDFGTGYSSLTYLKRMPVDKLKIDRSFVRDLPHDTSDAAIVRTIVAIARTLGLKVLAEGVETPEQLAFLRAVGCDECQGFLFGPAVPADQFAAQLRDQKLPIDP